MHISVASYPGGMTLRNPQAFVKTCEKIPLTQGTIFYDKLLPVQGILPVYHSARNMVNSQPTVFFYNQIVTIFNLLTYWICIKRKIKIDLNLRSFQLSLCKMPCGGVM
jgi:hypothetical protein